MTRTQRILTNGFAQRQALSSSCSDYHNLPTVQHGPNTDGQGHPWHYRDIIVEETRVGENCVIRQRLDACSRHERGAYPIQHTVVPAMQEFLPGSLNAICPSSPI